MKPLENSVALVAGATRGAGRGIARALGEAGATVYCTGRSSRGDGSRGTAAPRPETIEETAELVTAAGGRGVAIRADHTVESEVAAVVERIRSEAGRLDVLVNDIWGGEKLVQWRTPFWELNIDDGRTLVERAVMTHIVTSRHAVPLMLESKGRLILEITDGNAWYYRGNLFYDLVKNAVIRLAYGMAWELRRKGISAVALTPGFLRSEEMLETFGVTEANWQDGAKVEPHFIASETPLFVGRAVAALAADPDVAKKSGRVFSSWALSDEYGFVDADGSSPHWGRYWEKTFGVPLRKMDENFYAYGDGVIERIFKDWP